MTRPGVTVIIPAHNEAATIGATVDSAWTQTLTPTDVIVIDDGSTDHTAEVANHHGARVVHAPGGMKSRAQNAALPHVHTDHVALLDADTLLAPDALELLAATLISRRLDAVGGAVLPKPAQLPNQYVLARYYEYVLSRRWLRRTQDAIRRIYVLSGAIMLLRVDTLRAIGGFPEVAIGDDTELTWTLYDHGARIGFAPDALAYTTEPDTFAVYCRQTRRWSASSFQVVRRHKAALRHPNAALLVATQWWDNLSVSFMQVVTLLVWARHGLAWAGLIAAVPLTQTAISTAIAARDMGWRLALKALPPRAWISVVTRWIFIWSFVNEMILNRPYSTWSGRQTITTGATA